MLDAVAAVRSWIARKQDTCVVVASVGAGKSHLLAAARHELVDAVVMPSADGSDCTEFIALLKSGLGRVLIADDLDRLSKGSAKT
jgi:DNA replication protein DnaC